MTDSHDDIAATLGLGSKRRGLSRWFLIAGLLVLAGLGAAWWMQETEKRSTVTYQTEPVSRGALSVTVTATGTIQPTNVVEISSELSGTVTEVLVDFNDTVTSGQVLARLDTVQLEARLAMQAANHAASIAQLESARASLTEAELDYETVKQLDDRGVTTRSNLNTTKAKLDRAVANVSAAEANLELATANLASQKAELAKATIVSPIDGIVLHRDVDPGQIVAASFSAPELFTIAEDLSQMELQVDVAEADIGRIAVGDTAEFTVDAYDDKMFPAQISQVRFGSDTTDGLVTYKAILSVANQDLLLRPGMTATADILVAHHDNVLLVPNAALRFAPPQVIEDENENRGSRGGLLGLIMPRRTEGAERITSDRTVWVLRNGVATEIAVDKGDTDGQNTLVTSGELSEGDKVIVDMTEGR